jgi:hypothetical protein
MDMKHTVPEAHTPRLTSLTEKLAIVRQMVATLDTATIAGQRHLMAKVLAFIDGQVDRAISFAAPENQDVLLARLRLLRSEASRQLPSVPVFGERTESLIALLTPAA